MNEMGKRCLTEITCKRESKNDRGFANASERERRREERDRKREHRRKKKEGYMRLPEKYKRWVSFSIVTNTPTEETLTTSAVPPARTELFNPEHDQSETFSYARYPAAEKITSSFSEPCPNESSRGMKLTTREQP